jgi:hypothetical protein
MSIEITINGKPYSLDEARKLYGELHVIFGAPVLPMPTMPNPPWSTNPPWTSRGHPRLDNIYNTGGSIS